jgi:hypothetical protein
VPTSKVVIDDLVGQRYQQAMAAVGTFDPGFLTNTRSPLVGTSGRIAGFASLALPSERISIGTTVKQSAKQSDFFIRAEPGRLGLLRGCGRGHRPLKVDAVRIEHGTEPCIFGGQTFHFADFACRAGVANGMATLRSLNTNCQRVVQSLSFR